MTIMIMMIMIMMMTMMTLPPASQSLSFSPQSLLHHWAAILRHKSKESSSNQQLAGEQPGLGAVGCHGEGGGGGSGGGGGGGGDY